MSYTGKKYALTEDGKSVFGDAGKSVFGDAGKSFTVDYETPRSVALVSDKGVRLTVPCKLFGFVFREVKSRGKSSGQDG